MSSTLIGETVTSPLEDLRRVECMVRRILGPSADRESIAVDIWLGAWRKGVRVSYQVVYHKCVDEMRRRKEIRLEERDPRVERPKDDNEAKDVVNVLFEKANLTDLERKALYFRFYRELPFRALSDELGAPLTTTVKIVNEALGKLRDAAERNNPL